MNRDDVVRALLRIKSLSDDDKAAHEEEDNLYIQVLQTIADGSKDGKQLAKLALTAQTINFNRWYS